MSHISLLAICALEHTIIGVHHYWSTPLVFIFFIIIGYNYFVESREVSFQDLDPIIPPKYTHKHIHMYIHVHIQLATVIDVVI